MFKILAILKREYLSRVKKKSFIVLTLLGPILLAAIYSLPVLFLTLSGGERRLAVADLSGNMLGRFRQELAERKRLVEEGPEAGKQKRGFDVDRDVFRLIDATQAGETMEKARARLDRALTAEEFDAYLILGPDVDAEGNFVYGSRSSADVPGSIENALTHVAVGERARRRGLGLEAKDLQALTRPVEVNPVRIGKEGKPVSEGFGQQAVAVGLVWGMSFVFYLTFLIWGSTIIQGVVEEKGSRIVEVLLSSVTSTQFLLGKVIGIGLVALTQLVVWLACALAMMMWGTSALPQMADLVSKVEIGLFAWFVLMFLVGFAIYSMLYAAIGAMVTTIQEAQQAAFPVTIFIIIAFFCLFAVQRSPDSTLAVVASLFPLTSPLVLLMRLGISEPPLWQVALSLVLQGAALLGVTWLAARIFRVGLLMYGKRATVPEILRWIRA